MKITLYPLLKCAYLQQILAYEILMSKNMTVQSRAKKRVSSQNSAIRNYEP